MASAPPRRSDVDFADVFGGPPRRSSGNEHRSRRGSLDYASSFGSSAPRTRSGGSDAPVFGDHRGSSDRRRHLGEEFYKDIFPGSEVPSPRLGGVEDWGDVFGVPASPGSTSRPRSSFSMRFNRGTDGSMPTSLSRQTSNRNDDGTSYAYSVPASPNASLDNYLAQGAAQQDSRKKPFSFLSRFRSHQSGKKKNSSNHVSSMGSECEGTPISMESIMATDKLHFSFYKWAGKGAFLVLPATAEEKAGDIIGLRRFPQVVVQSIDLINDEDSMSTATGASKSQQDYEDSKSGKHSTNSATKEGAIPLFFDGYMQGSKQRNDHTKNDASSASLSSKSYRLPSGEKSHSSRVKEKVKGFIKIFSPESSPKHKRAPETLDQTSVGKNGSKSELQDKFTISSLEANEDVQTAQMNNQNAFIPAPNPVNDVQERMEQPGLFQVNDVQERMDKPVLTHNSKTETKTDTISRSNKAASNGMKQGSDHTKNDASSASLSAKSYRLPSGEKSHSSVVKEKVKGFIKIFSPESSPKRKRAPETPDKTSVGKNGSKSELQDKFTISSLEANEDVQTAQMNNQNAFIPAPYSVNDVQERMEQPGLFQANDVQERMDKPVLTDNSKTETKTDTISGSNKAASNESIHYDTKDKADNTIHHEEIDIEDFDGCVVEHVSEGDDQEKELIKVSESKIREWSRGKEGNIRSLLSTLQYVLWPGSGWKQVPLVDIIEGAAVKKAYQRALLCLHPDKLQQRGASMHQKYIAEKVFDILQEAWKEFNSVTFG